MFRRSYAYRFRDRYGERREEQENETNKDDLLVGDLGPFGNNFYRDKIIVCRLP